MCEQYVAVSSTPFRIGDLWPMTERLERFGLAGFGWGATWLDAAGELRTHRHLETFRDDPERERLGAIETRALLVHLRRPSKFSTIGFPDTQPFDDPAGRYAFSHNGDLANDGAFRRRYRDEGRIHGKADTEVGARWLEDAWASAASPVQALERLHDTFGGHANLAVLTRDGAAHHYAGNDENPVFTFDLPAAAGTVRLACTGMYSLDRSIFKYVAPEATTRRLVPRASTASL
jgi:predicted glutamine amidotransferase